MILTLSGLICASYRCLAILSDPNYCLDNIYQLSTRKHCMWEFNFVAADHLPQMLKTVFLYEIKIVISCINRCDDVPLHRNCWRLWTSNGNQPLGSLPAHQSAVASVETWWTGQNHQLVFSRSLRYVNHIRTKIYTKMEAWLLAIIKVNPISFKTSCLLFLHLYLLMCYLPIIDTFTIRYLYILCIKILLIWLTFHPNFTAGEINFDNFFMKENYDKGQVYPNSKLANVLFTRQLAKKLKGEWGGGEYSINCYYCAFYLLTYEWTVYYIFICLIDRCPSI